MVLPFAMKLPMEPTLQQRHTRLCLRFLVPLLPLLVLVLLIKEELTALIKPFFIEIKNALV